MEEKSGKCKTVIKLRVEFSYPEQKAATRWFMMGEYLRHKRKLVSGLLVNGNFAAPSPKYRKSKL